MRPIKIQSVTNYTFLVTNPEGLSRMKSAETKDHAKNLCLEQDRFKFRPSQYKCKKLL